MLDWILDRIVHIIWGPDPKADPWMTLDWTEEDEDGLL